MLGVFAWRSAILQEPDVCHIALLLSHVLLHSRMQRLQKRVIYTQVNKYFEQTIVYALYSCANLKASGSLRSL